MFSLVMHWVVAWQDGSIMPKSSKACQKCHLIAVLVAEGILACNSW